MKRPKTKAFNRPGIRYCVTCRFLMSQGIAHCVCSHPKNLPLEGEFPRVSLMDHCADHKHPDWYGEPD